MLQVVLTLQVAQLIKEVTILVGQAIQAVQLVAPIVKEQSNLTTYVVSPL